MTHCTTAPAWSACVLTRAALPCLLRAGRAYETLTAYAIRSSLPEEQAMLSWKLGTRRPAAENRASEHFSLDHMAELGQQGL